MAKDRERTRRDMAGVGPDPAIRNRLVPMDALDGFDIADGEPDIRGWEVCTLNGHEIGEVEDLLVDPERGEVVMLEVEMRDNGVHAEVPIRAVQLDRDRKKVLIDSADIAGGERSDMRARDRIQDDEREHLRTAYGSSARRVSYAEREERAGAGLAEDEEVIERRPVIEETVVRKRIVEE